MAQTRAVRSPEPGPRARVGSRRALGVILRRMFPGGPVTSPVFSAKPASCIAPFRAPSRTLAALAITASVVLAIVGVGGTPLFGASASGETASGESGSAPSTTTTKKKAADKKAAADDTSGKD